MTIHEEGIEFDAIVAEFKSKLETLKQKYNLDFDNFLIDIDMTSKPYITDGDGKRLFEHTFLKNIKFILATNR
jgi:hypothetical protein